MSADENGGRPSRRAGQGDRLEAVAYICTSLLPLAQIARHHDLDTLTYLIDVAKMEADEVLEKLRR